MRQLHWVRRRGKWHGWSHGAAQSLCGRLTRGIFHDGQALEIREVLDSDERPHTCTRCRTLARDTRAAPDGPADGARAWESFIRLHLRKCRPKGADANDLRASDTDVHALAELLTEVGPPEDAHARQVWEAVKTLLLTPWYRDGAAMLPLHRALGKLPLHVGALSRVAAALRAWSAITGRGLTRDRVKADQVVEVILQVPDVEPYIRHLHTRGLDHLAAVFHPNTLERAKRETGLRGSFAGSGSYWDANKAHITIVED